VEAKRSEPLVKLLQATFGRIPSDHDDLNSKYLIDASKDSWLDQSAIERMGNLRWPEFQDPLGELARNGSGYAVTALGGYMNDRTVEYLLDAIGRSSNEAFRKGCLNQLDSIRRYQDEKARWTTRKGGQQARDDAIAQLLPMLNDGDEKVRAQAILSLATLDAVEQLPKIVQFLKDKSPAVRQAAQQALDKLNAAEAKKP
jgi:HEAT repeat protein